MANTYDRRINLYINGKEVENNIASIRKAMYQLTNQQAHMTLGSREYYAHAEKIKNLKGIMAQHARDVGNMQSPLQKVIGFAKGLLPAFSFGAIAAGAKMAFDKVVAATDTLSTQWAIFMGGMKGATDEFFRSIATGDWSNLFTNMQRAMELGREYEETLDRVEKNQRSLDIAEADALNKKLDLEAKLRNKGLSRDERIEAGKQRLQLEKELERQRGKIAQELFDMELKTTADQAKLSKEALWLVMKNQNSETRVKAEELNKRIKDYKDYYKSLNTLMSIEKRAEVGDNAGIKLKQMREDLLKEEPVVLLYAQALRKEGNVTDEQLNKLVASYGKLQQAQNSALINIPKVNNMVNSLLAGEENANAKADKTAESLADKLRQALVPDTDESKMDTVEAEMLRQAELMAEKKASEEEWTEFLKNQAEIRADIEQEELQKQQENFELDKQITEARKQLKSEYMDAIGQVAGALASMFKEGSAAQIAAIAVEKGAAIAQIIFQTAVANAKAVAMSPLTFGQPWVTINTISAGASIAALAATTISQFKDKRNNNVPGYAAGGFTTGEGIYIAGEGNKKEWIAPNWMLSNPRTQPAIAALESIRSTSGAGISPPGSGGVRLQPGGGSASDPELRSLIAANTAAMLELKNLKIYTTIEDIKKGDKKYTEIQNTRGL